MAITSTLILVFSIFPAVLMAETPQCSAKTDVVFILDSSSSVGATDYKIMLSFIVSYTRNFDVGIDKVQFGAIVFSLDAQIVFNLNTYSDRASLEQAILDAPYLYLTTNTDKALELARTSAFTAASGARDGVPKIAVVFTDGKSNNPTETGIRATFLKAAGVKVIAIGIGNNIDNAELQVIASSPQDVLEVTGFDALNTIKHQLTSRTCNQADEFTCSCRQNGMAEKLDKLLALLERQAHSDEYFDIMNTGKKEWRITFRGTPYINKSVYEAYKRGGGAQSNAEPGCKQLDATLPCRNHYRNDDVLDHWTNIDEVALTLYLGNTQVKHMIFDGQGSTYMDWLSQERLKLSSWDDAKTETFNYFSIEGHDLVNRRFFINRNYGDCPNDAGWIAALDPGIDCEWEIENRQSFPVFKYSRADTYTNWTTGDFGTASFMAVFVKYTTGGAPGITLFNF